MADVVNLRTVRKRAIRKAAEAVAAANRQAHGASKPERAFADAERDKASHMLDQHRIEREDRG